MKRLIVLALAAALLAPACSDPADSEECRTWQKELLEARAAFSLADIDYAVVDYGMAETRPDGCPWPEGA